MRLASVKYITLLLLLITSCVALAQYDTVTIRGNVIDSYTRKPLSGISIINPKSNEPHVTDNRGAFYFNIQKNDTLFLFYPGYKTAKFSVADSALKKEYTLMLYVEPLNTGLNQSVIIKAPKTLEDIEAERKKLGLTPKELERPIIEPFTSPISALYELLSNRAQEREKLKKQMVEDDRRRIFKELLNYYNENGLMDLPEDHYDRFIDYCNLPIEFLKYNTDYEITKTVIDAYKKYVRQQGW
jgi:hypothetical protein